MTGPLRLTEEMSAGAARLRVDVYGGEPRDHVLDDLNFLNYRLADVPPEVTLAEPDIVGTRTARKPSYDGRVMTFTGPWPARPEGGCRRPPSDGGGGLHLSHSAAVHRGRPSSPRW
jgi:hypothetical protein